MQDTVRNRAATSTTRNTSECCECSLAIVSGVQAAEHENRVRGPSAGGEEGSPGGEGRVRGAEGGSNPLASRMAFPEITYGTGWPVLNYRPRRPGTGS
ncbi:unnamed protein product [Danaus chrysippus]|uniref:(African queen) hypothetical protein n=1 Tax=Danaus chrysippus TaxID=151541 RepID=A0A8J2QTH8_9NEOP|nr:unnamed protein product [Danaus chrysippus]